MNSRINRHLVPQGIYLRSALILLLPVITVSLVVFIVFVQRHFDKVTRQMVSNLVPEINMLVELVDNAADRDAAIEAVSEIANSLRIRVEFDTGTLPEASTERQLFDFTGSVVDETLTASIPNIVAVDLRRIDGYRMVRMDIETRFGIVHFIVWRSTVSASNPHQLLVIVGFTAILMTTVSIVFLRNQLRPIRRLAKASEAFGRGQAFHFSPSGAAEIRSAGEAFLEMRDRIERHVAQRTLMLSSISHDLKTPLTRMTLALHLLEKSKEVDDILRDVEAMEQMVDEFLDFVKGNEGEALAMTDPIGIARSVVSATNVEGISIDLEISNGIPEDLSVSLRPLAIRRALTNLIENSRKFANAVTLRIECLPNEFRYIVEDDGPGIPKEFREEAIRPFERLDRARSQNKGGGVGLGLAIAQDVAIGHGGTLELGSSPSLGGLKAAIVLPI